MPKIKSLFCFVLLTSFSAQAQQPFAVVELFTSEGCLSCPPAEKVLSEFKADAEKNKQSIFFLEYHVDYWNRLGWKDPFSKNQFTLRQENYSRVLAGKELYTPQLVVNGESECTGSNRTAAQSAIQKAASQPASAFIKLTSKEIINDTLILQYATSKADNNASVKIAITEDNVESQVTRGENEGKKLHHDALVRIFYSSSEVQQNGTLRIPLRGFVPKPGMQLIAFVQHKQSMKILAASRMIY